MVPGARRGASRTWYARRRSRQPDVSCAVDLFRAAGRILQEEAWWSVSNLLIPGVSEQCLALQVQDHEFNSMKSGAGEEFVFVETCLARISWCANRVFDPLCACFAEYHVSHVFCAESAKRGKLFSC